MAFGSTRRAGVRAEDDETLRHLVEAQTEAVCIVAKSSEVHVVDALRTTLDEAVAMVADSVAFLRANDLRVFLDAEHFFDGYKANPEFTLRILQAAEEAGAETLVLCDTNGGTLPYEVERIVATVLDRFETQVGVHFHNDSGCAVANSLAGVSVGATHVQGCVNGYGERAGNADLAAVVPDLSLKLRVSTIPADRLPLLTPVSHHIAELVNIAPNPQQPFVGASVFAHKAGLHTSAIARRSDAYEHISPDLVGNGTRFVVSEMAGRSTLAMKAEELGLELDSDAMTSVLDSLKRLEYEGYHFEVADGSLELLLRQLDRLAPGRSSSWSPTGSSPTRATSCPPRRPSRCGSAASGSSPRPRATARSTPSTAPCARPSAAGYPALEGVHLVDYRVRVLDSAKGTGSVTRVLIDSTDGDRTWTTIGVSENIIAASWQALSDSVVYGLLHAAGRRRLNWTPSRAAWHRSAAWRSPDRRPPARQEHPVTQPSFVPVVEADQVRRAYQLHVPSIWTTSRPSELRGTRAPAGAFLGTPGPDQGFALKLARRFEDRLVLAPGEHAEDAIVGLHGGGHAPGGQLRAGPGHPRPDAGLHPVGLPARGAGRPGGGPGAAVPGRRRTTTRCSARSPTACPRRPCGSPRSRSPSGWTTGATLLDLPAGD